MTSMLCLVKKNRYSIRDMSEILGMSRGKVRWFVAELERRKYIHVKREWVSNISRKTNDYTVNI